MRMEVHQIRDPERALPRFLEEFSDCFGWCDTRRYLGVYVDGQMSELQRKSVEPMALRSGVPPRSLRAFLSLLEWDEQRLLDRLQQHVAWEHVPPHPRRRRCPNRLSPPPQHRSQTQPFENGLKENSQNGNQPQPNKVLLEE
jgi:SRSO17 transposase